MSLSSKNTLSVLKSVKLKLINLFYSIIRTCWIPASYVISLYLSTHEWDHQYTADFSRMFSPKKWLSLTSFIESDTEKLPFLGQKREW